MIRKSIATTAAVAAITVGAMSATASTASAGVSVHVHGGHYLWGGPVYGHWHGGYRNPCRHWKRKWHRTGRYRFLRKYRRCMRRWYY